MGDDKIDFSTFLLKEYEYIAQAHFESTKQVTYFFRYYLVILSAPAVVFFLFKDDLTKLASLLQGQASEINIYIAYFFITISMVGVAVCFFIIKIKQTGILYARAVNGIRKYFFNKDGDHTIRVLPISIEKPSYFEVLFLPIIFSFALINSIYFLLGMKILYNESCYVVYSIIFFLSHFIFYYLYSIYRSKKYLK